MSEKKIELIKKYLALQLEKYVLLFKKEYKDFIPSDTLDFLNSITNYENLIKFEDTGTITCMVRDGVIYFPILVFKILDYLEKIPGFGISPNHSTYNQDNLIINDNTFSTYIRHVFLAGLSPKEFFEEMLLHETMHLCGMDGADAFQEGLTEFKTRELAKKYGLKTNGCGYPKEVKIINRLQEIFGSKFMNKMAFYMSPKEKANIIYEELGQEGLDFFGNIFSLMQQEFYIKYYQYQSLFNGITAPLKKNKKYNDIDYSNVYKVIEEYCNSQAAKNNR